MSTVHKTNAIRMLESLGIAHDVAAHPVGEEHFDAVQVATLLGVSPDILFKTLVTRGGPDEVFVFCIPGSAELDLKKAARVAGVRSVELVPLNDLTPLTGYVRGGCSPIGMKKKFPDLDRRNRLRPGVPLRECRCAGAADVHCAGATCSGQRTPSTPTSCENSHSSRPPHPARRSRGGDHGRLLGFGVRRHPRGAALLLTDAPRPAAFPVRLGGVRRHRRAAGDAPPGAEGRSARGCSSASWDSPSTTSR